MSNKLNELEQRTAVTDEATYEHPTPPQIKLAVERIFGGMDDEDRWVNEKTPTEQAQFWYGAGALSVCTPLTAEPSSAVTDGPNREAFMMGHKACMEGVPIEEAWNDYCDNGAALQEQEGDNDE